jgi:hypothetical protein
MNAKQLKLIAIVLGAAVLLYLPRIFRDDGSGGSIDVGDGFRFVLEDAVTRIDIVEPDNADTIRLEDGSNGWTVDGYRADETKMENLLEVLPDLYSDVLVARNPTNHTKMGVSESGRRISVYTNGPTPLEFYLGNRDIRGAGYFVRALGIDAVFRLDSRVSGYLNRERDGWRPRTIAAIDTARVRQIVLQREGTETVFHRGDSGWTAGEVAADSASLQGILGLLPNLSLTTFTSEEEAEAADFSQAQAAVEVFYTTEEAMPENTPALSLLLIEDEEQGDWLVRHAAGSEVYRLATFTVNRLLPNNLTP